MSLSEPSSMYSLTASVVCVCVCVVCVVCLCGVFEVKYIKKAYRIGTL